MLAQKFIPLNHHGHITAVELDDSAAAQAQQNINDSVVRLLVR